MPKSMEQKIEKLKANAKKLTVHGNIDAALVLISCIAGIQYEYNQRFRDDELESLLLTIGSKIKRSQKMVERENNGRCIVFYDGFGLDYRGLAYIYIKALCRLNYHVIYLVNENRLEHIPNIKKLLICSGSEVIGIPWNTAEIKRAEFIYAAIADKKPAGAFLYTSPSDVAGILAFNQLEGITVRYQINLTDHAFWLGFHAFDFILEFRNFGASVSCLYREIKKEKILLQPMYPVIKNNIEFQGYPFKKRKDDFVLFSGGFLYKTEDKEHTYYKIVRRILKDYSNVKFWYAGSGKNDEMNRLQADYPDRVFHTAERDDLMQIMKNCDAYLNTFPMIGGLMTQYAAMAGLVPLTYNTGEHNRGVLSYEYEEKVYFSSWEELFREFDKLYSDRQYRKEIGESLKNSVISEEQFEENLEMIISDKNSRYEVVYQKTDIVSFREIYKYRFTNKDFCRHVATRSNYPLIKVMPLYYMYCLGNRLGGVMKVLKNRLR